MIPPPFEYALASDIARAIKLLAGSGGEAKILAGGQSLIPLMRFRLAEPARKLDKVAVTLSGERLEADLDACTLLVHFRREAPWKVQRILEDEGVAE